MFTGCFLLVCLPTLLTKICFVFNDELLSFNLHNYDVLHVFIGVYCYKLYQFYYRDVVNTAPSMDHKYIDYGPFRNDWPRLGFGFRLRSRVWSPERKARVIQNN